MSRWWRRNAAAFVVGPLAAWGTWIVVGEPLRSHWEAGDPDRIEVEAGDEVAWAPGATLRFVDVSAPGPVVVPDREEPFVAPPGTRVWRVRFEARAASAEVQGLCRIGLLDREGRRFSPALVELTVLDGDGGCIPDLEDDPAGYDRTFWFLLPADAEPVELTVVPSDDSAVFVTSLD